MRKRLTKPTKQPLHPWAIYRLKGTPTKLVGIVDNQPDAAAAIKAAIEEYRAAQQARAAAGAAKGLKTTKRFD